MSDLYVIRGGKISGAGRRVQRPSAPHHTHADRSRTRMAKPKSTTKRCTRCHIEKPSSEFHERRYRVGGLQAKCKPCMRALKCESRARHRDSVNASLIRYRKAHPERRLAWGQRQRAANRTNAEFLAKDRARSKRWRDANPERARAGVKRWTVANPDRYRTLQRKSDMTRKARKRDAFIETVDPEVVFTRDAGVCGICTTPVGHDENWHVDHIMPLSKGGPHSYGNVQLAHARCNKSKGAKVLAA